MGKIITAKRTEGEGDRAEQYVRTYILFPSGLMGLLAMVIGVFSLVYQLIIETYNEMTFLQSSGLLAIGILLGWGVTQYHKYILREHPAFFASRMKKMTQGGPPKPKKMTAEVELIHRGRSLVPLWYFLGIGLLLGLALWSMSTDSLDYMAAATLPWAGFFWGKLFSWRKIIPPVAPEKKNRK